MRVRIGDGDDEQLRARLVQRLQKIDDAKDEWPDDKSQAYRFVSGHILAALTESQKQ